MSPQLPQETAPSSNTFLDASGRVLDLDAVLGLVYDFVTKKPEAQYQIIVGTDSHASDEVSFVTAITVRRVGNGGIYFWTRSYKKQFPSLRDRMYAEAISSIMLAEELRGRLKDILHEDYFWNDQIHIDIGENGKTKDLIDGIVGMVRGYGFEAVIKPFAFGASAVADRHT